MVTDLDGNGEVEVFSFIKDRQNSVKVIMNEKGEAIQEINYSAYGVTQITERGQIKHKIPNAFYYTSRELEPETGDYFYRARFYDPRTGRFLSEDPIGINSGDLNFYRYVKSNPISMTDPTGKWPEWIDDGVCHITGRCDPEDVDSDDWSDTIGDAIKDLWPWGGDDNSGEDNQGGSSAGGNLGSYTGGSSGGSPGGGYSCNM